mmetsp:Transcript_39654/g.78092  ORF Transcript_39654/g.78092 Transcript_39654/m.78092 type:complete len:300 (-) Transcript_39654:709-1608(-)
MRSRHAGSGLSRQLCVSHVTRCNDPHSRGPDVDLGAVITERCRRVRRREGGCTYRDSCWRICGTVPACQIVVVSGCRHNHDVASQHCGLNGAVGGCILGPSKAHVNYASASITSGAATVPTLLDHPLNPPDNVQSRPGATSGENTNIVNVGLSCNSVDPPRSETGNMGTVSVAVSVQGRDETARAASTVRRLNDARCSARGEGRTEIRVTTPDTCIKNKNSSASSEAGGVVSAVCDAASRDTVETVKIGLRAFLSASLCRLLNDNFRVRFAGFEALVEAEVWKAEGVWGIFGNHQGGEA